MSRSALLSLVLALFLLPACADEEEPTTTPSPTPGEFMAQKEFEAIQEMAMSHDFRSLYEHLTVACRARTMAALRKHVEESGTAVDGELSDEDFFFVHFEPVLERENPFFWDVIVLREQTEDKILLDASYREDTVRTIRLIREDDTWRLDSITGASAFGEAR